MSNSDQVTDFFDTLSRVLLRTWIFGYVILIAWVGIVLFAKEPSYRLLSNWYGLSSHELDLTNYCGIAFLKLLVIVFFLLPWLAIRLVLKGRKR